MIDLSHFTPTEQNLLRKLLDGQLHRKEHLILQLYNNGPGAKQCLYQHIYNIRKKLPSGLALICEYNSRVYWYRIVRLLNSDE